MGAMSTIRKRLDYLEERRAFREFVEYQRHFKDRSSEELLFLGIHGYFPEAADDELPPEQVFTIGGIRMIVRTEWVP